MARKVVQIYFNTDNELENEVLEWLKNKNGIGFSISNYTKQMYYAEMKKDIKTTNENITIVEKNIKRKSDLDL